MAEVIRPIWNQCAVIPGKMAYDRFAAILRPGQPHSILRKLVWMRDIKGRREGRLFADLIEAEDLCDLDDFVATAGEILKCDGAVAGAKIDSKAETRAHLIGYELSLGSAKYRAKIT